MMTIVKERLIMPQNKRIIAISDVHGHYTYLKKLLRKVNFTSDDILFIVGDIIEKGPDSLKTLRYVMELCNKFTVYPCIGNVDAWRILMFDDESDENNNKLIEYIALMKKYWGGCFFTDMCTELNIQIGCENDILPAKQAIKEHFKREFDFLCSLPTLIETQNFIFVHGGLPTNDLNKLSNYNKFDFLKNDAFMEKGLCFNKYVIVGHWPVILYSHKIPQLNPIVNEKQKIISIDGGCGIKEGCQLNALIINNINSTEFKFESYDDLRIGYAKTAQEESVDSIYIKWTDSKIEILEKGNEFTLVKHESSGIKLNIPNYFIEDIDGNAHCSDYTNYCLNINIGDKLSIIKETSEGYYIKKNGVIGWFYGDIDSIR